MKREMLSPRYTTRYGDLLASDNARYPAPRPETAASQSIKAEPGRDVPVPGANNVKG